MQQPPSTTQTFPAAANHFARRQFLLGALTVTLLLAAVAVLTLALIGDGGDALLDRDSAPPNRPTLVVTGLGEARAPADRAVLQLLLVKEDQFSSARVPVPGATPGSVEDVGLTDVITAIVNQGVPRDAITVVVSPAVSGVIFGPSDAETLRIDVTIPAPGLDGLNAIVRAADAATDTELQLTQVGAEYSLSDCRPVARQAREQATTDARRRAAEQATVLDGTLGDLIMVTDIVPDILPSGRLPEADGCLVSPDTASVFEGASVGVTVPAFDPIVAPEVRAVARVTLTFDLQET